MEGRLRARIGRDNRERGYCLSNKGWEREVGGQCQIDKKIAVKERKVIELLLRWSAEC